MTTYIRNLMIVHKYKKVPGCIIECGTWRGGMIAGMGNLLNDDKRQFHLFDSFEGLPDAEPIDGSAANNWQNDKTSPGYYDNCKAELKYVEKAISIAGLKHVSIHKGWFSETLPLFDKNEKIAILRLDGDWYSSTMECLDHLYDCVMPGGVIIIDDYHTWDGCTRAVHDFLSKRGLSDRIAQWHNDVCYIEKHGEEFATNTR